MSNISAPAIKVEIFHENIKKIDHLTNELENLKNLLPSSKIFSNINNFISICQKSIDNLLEFKAEYNQDFLKEDSLLARFVESTLFEIQKDIVILYNYSSGIVSNATDDGFKSAFNELERKIFTLKKITIDLLASSNYAREIYEKGFEQSLSNIQGVLEEIDTSREFILNKKTKTIYSEARKSNEKKFEQYQWNFFITIFSTLIISVILFFTYKNKWIEMDFWDYVIIKVMILTVGITLITYFLRHAAIYRKKADQAEQTHLELTAFPSYIIGMSPDDLSSLKKDLALKYFGKDIETEPYNKMGDLVQDQMKISLEIMKASSEAFKNINVEKSSEKKMSSSP